MFLSYQQQNGRLLTSPTFVSKMAVFSIAWLKAPLSCLLCINSRYPTGLVTSVSGIRRILVKHRRRQISMRPKRRLLPRPLIFSKVPNPLYHHHLTQVSPHKWPYLLDLGQRSRPRFFSCRGSKKPWLGVYLSLIILSIFFFLYLSLSLSFSLV